MNIFQKAYEGTLDQLSSQPIASRLIILVLLLMFWFGVFKAFAAPFEIKVRVLDDALIAGATGDRICIVHSTGTVCTLVANYHPDNYISLVKNERES